MPVDSAANNDWHAFQEALGQARRWTVLAWGNPSRGDDGLGPAFLQALTGLEPNGAGGPAGPQLIEDFQLQIEHVTDLLQQDLVLFVDATASGAAPYTLLPVAPQRDRSYSSHALSPAALLYAFREFTGTEPPAAFCLAIRGEQFGLGEPMSRAAQDNLQRSLCDYGAATILR